MAGEAIIEILIEGLGAGLEMAAVGDSKSKKLGCFITLGVIALIIVGVVYFVYSGDPVSANEAIQKTPEVIHTK